VLHFLLLLHGTGKDNVKKPSLTSVLDDKTPQLADQTFNINNWGLGKIERNLLTDIKAKNSTLCLTNVNCIITPNKFNNFHKNNE